MCCQEETSTECPFCTMLKAFEKHPVSKHLRSAQREILMAMRSVLDARIEALKDEDESAGPQKVEVQ